MPWVRGLVRCRIPARRREPALRSAAILETRRRSIPRFPSNQSALPDDIKVPDLDQLLALLPHRYPFLLIDRVLELSKTHIVAVKNVSFNEPYFAGHFPGR